MNKSATKNSETRAPSPHHYTVHIVFLIAFPIVFNIDSKSVVQTHREIQQYMLYIYVHCREEGCIELYIPDDQEISQEMSRGRSPGDISRAEGNLEVGGDVQPNTSRFEAVYGHFLIINPSLGIYQEIHPCRASSIDCVKINTSLPMMR